MRHTDCNSNNHIGLRCTPSSSGGFVSCVPSFDSSRLTDCTICANESSRGRGVLTSASTAGTRRRGRCRRSIHVGDCAGSLGTTTRGRGLTRSGARSRFPPEGTHGSREGATCTTSPSTTGDYADRPSQGTREGSGGLRLDRTPGRVDRPGLPARRRLHPAAVDEFPALSPGEGATRRPRPRRAGLGRRGGPGRHPRDRPRVPDPGPQGLPGARSRRVLSAATDHLPRRADASAAGTPLRPRSSLPAVATDRGREVAAFEALGIERRILPQRTCRGAAGNIRRHFDLRLPLALDAERAVFVYADPGYETSAALRVWGAAHRELRGMLWDCGRKIEVVAVARGWEETSRADTVVGNWARDLRPAAGGASALHGHAPTVWKRRRSRGNRSPLILWFVSKCTLWTRGTASPPNPRVIRHAREDHGRTSFGAWPSKTRASAAERLRRLLHRSAPL